jgi:hypothetical protein
MSPEPAPPTITDPGALDRETVKRAAVATVLVLLIGLTFVWSYVGALHEPRFHGVELAVAGPAAVAQRLDRTEAFDAVRVPTRAAAVRRIVTRKAYGAVVSSPDGFEILTAQAAGISVATGLATDLPAALRDLAARGSRIEVTEVRPLPPVDSRGISPFYLAVGLVVAGYLGAAFLGLVFGTKPVGRRVWWRLAAIGVIALLMGIFSTAIVNALGPLRGAYVPLALAGILLCFAVGNLAVGLQAAFGVLGTGASILLFVVLGNPSSGGPFATELLPGFWRGIGPWLPTGAGVDLIRNIAYFDSNATARPVAALVGWTAVGMLLVAAFARVRPLGLGMKSDRELETAQAEAMSAAAAG